MPLKKTSVRLMTALSTLFISSAPLFADVQAGLDLLDAGDVAGAATSFQEAFEAGDGEGAFYLGRLFEFGVGVDADLARASNLYAAASNAGSVNAMNRLGLLYLEGTTLLKDYSAAQEQFCKAADAGDANGQLNCALLVRDGRGGEADADLAIKHLEAAAAQDNIAATNVLALMYSQGEDVPLDLGKAQELFAQTADLGNAMGLFELAKIHGTAQDGQAVDLVKAYSFANLAAVRQMPEAIAYRDELEALMDSAQILVAQKMSQDWTQERIEAQTNSQ